MNRSGPYLGDELGRFVAAADMSHISERALRFLKRNVLDTLGEHHPEPCRGSAGYVLSRIRRIDTREWLGREDSNL